MWEVDNRSPFAALGYFQRDRGGMEHWVVAIRGRFSILDDGLNRLLNDQGDIRVQPDYHDDQAEELCSEPDFSPFRPSVDFLLSGDIQAAEARAVNKVHVGFEIAGHTKMATAFGARRLRKRGRTLQLEGFEAFNPCRLSWRHALGGVDLMSPDAGRHHVNPIGIGWTAQWQDLPDGTEIVLPLIENTQSPIGEGPLPQPFGFGPLQPAWAPRAQHAGTYDDEWRKYEAPLLPSDFSEQFFQAAPTDQVFDLKGGEQGRVFGLHPQGDYGFRLPQAIIETTTWMGRDRFDVRPRLISVHVNGTDKTLEMVWNASIPCESGDMSVSRTRVNFKQMAGVVS